MSYFQWNAVYGDGRSLSEFNGDGSENKFQDIELDKLIRFESGDGQTLACYNVADGAFFVNGRRIDLSYKDQEGNVYGFTGACVLSSRRDLIQFKSAYIDVDPTGGHELVRGIGSWHIGYKTVLDFGQTKFHLKAILVLYAGQPPAITIRLVCNRDVEGTLTMINGQDRIETLAPLTENIGGEISWLLN